MAARITGCFMKVVPVVFTSIVAPVLVSLALKDIKEEDVAPPGKKQAFSSKGELPSLAAVPALNPIAQVGQASQQRAEAKSTKAEPAEVIQVIVHGAGKSPQDALQNALRAGISRAIAAQVGPDTRTKAEQAIFERISRNSAGLIRGWKELGTSKEWKLTGTLYSKEVAVELDRHVLLNRLHSEGR